MPNIMARMSRMHYDHLVGVGLKKLALEWQVILCREFDRLQKDVSVEFIVVEFAFDSDDLVLHVEFSVEFSPGAGGAGKAISARQALLAALQNNPLLPADMTVAVWMKPIPEGSYEAATVTRR